VGAAHQIGDEFWWAMPTKTRRQNDELAGFGHTAVTQKILDFCEEM